MKKIPSSIAAIFAIGAVTLAFHGRSACVEQRTLPLAAGGGAVPLRAADSPTAVLVVTAECAKCRIGVVTFPDVRALLQREGFAFRSVIASGAVAGRQFAVLLPEPRQAALDEDRSVLRALRVKTVPALVLVAADGGRRRVLPVEVPIADTVRLKQEIQRFR